MVHKGSLVGTVSLWRNLKKIKLRGFTRINPRTRTQEKMKKSIIPALAVLTVTAFTSHAQAQILWTASGPITGLSDIATNGSYFDAIKGSTFAATSDQTIGTTTFNIINSGGTEVDGPGHISLTNLAATNGGDGSFTSASPSSAAYANVLSGVSYIINGNPAGSINLSGLTSGNKYQVEVWDATSSTNSENDSALMSGVSPVELSESEFAVGTFTASGSTFSFTFSVPADHVTQYAGISAVAVREIATVPEPSTWALILGGLGFLIFLSRRNLLRL
jgi:hypothetical protein